MSARISYCASKSALLGLVDGDDDDDGSLIVDDDAQNLQTNEFVVGQRNRNFASCTEVHCACDVWKGACQHS